MIVFVIGLAVERYHAAAVTRPTVSQAVRNITASTPTPWSSQRCAEKFLWTRNLCELRVFCGFCVELRAAARAEEDAAADGEADRQRGAEKEHHAHADHLGELARDDQAEDLAEEDHRRVRAADTSEQVVRGLALN